VVSGPTTDRWITDSRRWERLPYYTRANAGEVLNDPCSPLGWTLVFEQGLLKGWLRGFVEFGVYARVSCPRTRRRWPACSAATST
jgi:hypothetical protein